MYRLCVIVTYLLHTCSYNGYVQGTFKSSTRNVQTRISIGRNGWIKWRKYLILNSPKIFRVKLSICLMVPYINHFRPYVNLYVVFSKTSFAPLMLYIQYLFIFIFVTQCNNLKPIRSSVLLEINQYQSELPDLLFSSLGQLELKLELELEFK